MRTAVHAAQLFSGAFQLGVPDAVRDVIVHVVEHNLCLLLEVLHQLPKAVGRPGALHLHKLWRDQRD
eukprot:scaffold1452_cov236-Pinguiococcus_pyrenoidosus.AAC.8